MDKLPVEVLQDIFIRIVPTSGEMRTSVSSRSLGFLGPLYISHVCRQWRGASLSFGALWSYLSIDCYKSETPKRRRALFDVYHTWLRRTNEVPLNFRVLFQLKDCNDFELHNMAECIITSLIRCQQRWKDVDFTWSLRVSPEFSVAEISDMPMLVSLYLRSDIELPFGNRRIPHISIANSPQLEDLNLSGAYSFECGESPIYSLQRARHQNNKFAWRHEVAEKVFQDQLKFAPNLKEFSAAFHCIRSEAVETQGKPSKDSSFLVHDIRRLSISKPPRDDLAIYAFPKVTLPSLEHLDYGIAKHGGVSALLDLIQRSRPPLETLEVVDVDCTTSPQRTFMLTLRLLPTLEGLIIRGTRNLKSLFGELTRDEGHKTCPALSKLRIGRWYITNEVDHKESWSALCSMLHSRFAGRATVSINSIHNLPVPIQRSDAVYAQIFDALNGQRFNDLSVTEGVIAPSP